MNTQPVTSRRLRIGTRRSRLALWQTEWVATELRRLHPGLEVEVVPVQTLGDRDKATSLVGLGRVGVFTKEIEEALLDDRCDLAVHSFKDLATAFPDGLAIGAVPKRADPRDAIVSRSGKTLVELEPGSVIGTSSLRRRALILHRRPDLRVIGLRGNVPTRLRAVGVDLDEGKDPTGEPLDATVMALAGLSRLGLDRHASEVLPVDEFLPAPAQGALAIQIRADDQRSASVLAPLDHGPTRATTRAERAFLARMEGGCHVPLGAFAEIDGDRVRLAGIVVDPDGGHAVEGERSGKDPEELGQALAEELCGRGAAEILSSLNTATDGGAGGR
ncbi:MAG: hydroxymethylbilane synthase [Deltaproteobacteria bacterium]|nr:hydroxymethylbilane synthase [Deltaproteobacteria bacterium]